MTTLIVLLTLAALIWIGPPLALAGWWLVDRRREQAWAEERPSFDDEPTQIYDALMCESMERAEGWA